MRTLALAPAGSEPSLLKAVLFRPAAPLVAVYPPILPAVRPEARAASADKVAAAMVGSSKPAVAHPDCPDCRCESEHLIVASAEDAASVAAAAAAAFAGSADAAASAAAASAAVLPLAA